MAGLIFSVFADTCHGSDGGHGEEDESRHFQPKLMHRAANRTTSLMHGRHDGAAHTAALDHMDDRLDGGAKRQREIFH